MIDSDDPAARAKYVFLTTTVGTATNTLVYLLFGSLSVYAAVQISPVAGGYAVVAAAAAGLGSTAAHLSDTSDGSAPELGWLARQATFLVVILYAHTLLLVATALGIALGVDWGIAGAALVPLVDRKLHERGVRFGVTSTAAFLYALIIAASDTAKAVSWRELRVPQVRFG